MTDRLLGAICSALDGRHVGNLKWRARTLKTARDRGAEEQRHGADVLGVLEVKLPDYSVTKGFLGQPRSSNRARLCLINSGKSSKSNVGKCLNEVSMPTP